MLRLVLAATFLGAVSALSFLPHDVDTARVEWTNADETNPIYPPISPEPEPDYDGDGTFSPDGSGEGNGGDGSGDGGGGTGDGTGDGGDPEGDGGTGEGNGEGDGEGTGPAGGGPGEPGVDEPGRRTESEAGGGLLGLSLPAQAAASLGLIALAFLALLPGRRMPEHLR